MAGYVLDSLPWDIMFLSVISSAMGVIQYHTVYGLASLSELTLIISDIPQNMNWGDYLAAGLAGYFAYRWWNNGGGDDTKRRLKSL